MSSGRGDFCRLETRWWKQRIAREKARIDIPLLAASLTLEFLRQVKLLNPVRFSHVNLRNQ
jgi:hypothetical protein